MKTVHSLLLRCIAFVVLIGILSGFPVHAATYYVRPTGSNTNPGTATAPWATLQHAANTAVAGDTVLVQPGTYVGAKFSRSGLSSAPITFRGQPGVVVNAPGSLNTNKDNLWIRNADYIIIEGFEVTKAPRSGIAIQGEPTLPTLGIVIRDNYCHHNGRWGIFTGYAQNVVIENNETSYSAAEHGIYVSNSSDNPIICWNLVHHNRASGIQINADPSLPGDGIVTNALIEENEAYENGVGGGAAINLASVRNSTIRNNLLYNNHASGIAGWDDGAGTSFGTKNNSFFHNTIVMPADGRFALVLINGSTGNVIKNNILLHTGTRGSIETDSSSLKSWRSDYNVVNNRFSYDEIFITLAQWRAKTQDAHSILSPGLPVLFTNAPRANYHLAPGSPAINAGTVVPVTKDLDGNKRPQGSGYDIGADEVPAPYFPPSRLPVNQSVSPLVSGAGKAIFQD